MTTTTVIMTTMTTTTTMMMMMTTLMTADDDDDDDIDDSGAFLNVVLLMDINFLQLALLLNTIVDAAPFWANFHPGPV